MWVITVALLAATCMAEQALRTCEPIRVKICQDIGYNLTGMPNLAGHDLQSDADFTLQTFSPLIQYGCSAQLHLFLCSVYVPMCTEKVAEPIGPCRKLCEAVKQRCVPVLQGFGFHWPAALNCSKFPRENNHEHMCMEGPGEKDAGVPPLSPPALLKPTRTTSPVTGHCTKYAKSNFFVFVNRSGRCAPLCEKDILYSSKDKKLAEVWMSVSAALCFLSSLLALLTLVIDGTGSLFRYPRRPLSFLILCYNLTSIGWGVRVIAGSTAVSCVPDLLYPSRIMLLAQDGLRNAKCAVVFLLLYYFGNAAAVWWVVLTVAWFLSSTRGWTHERIQQHSSLFHLAGWGLPAAQTIAVLVLRDVDADELTGTCFVGHQNTRSLLLFVLAPQFLYLVIGACLLSCGLLSLTRLRRDVSDKAESVTMRLGVFGVLYTIPAACNVASLFYEYYSREEWLLLAEKPQFQPKPSVWILILRIFMSLGVGITSILWVWSPRMFKTWTAMFRRLGSRGPYKQAPVKCQTLQYYEARPIRPVHTNKHKHIHPHRKSRKLYGHETVTAV